ncbi:MAG: hypothetical protein J5J00_02050 [Deltaproteobacteria bacterium]|nr:hypothetical protein [Deltaproteobacteria bacterium]
MASDFLLSVEFFAAVVTFLYLLKLLLHGEGGFGESMWRGGVEKRSLLNQHVHPRASA